MSLSTLISYSLRDIPEHFSLQFDAFWGVITFWSRVKGAEGVEVRIWK